MASSPRTKVRQTLQGAEMIQLATDPNARRSNWRPAAAEGKDESASSRRQRSGHAWPFISHYAERAPASQDSKPTPTSDSGS